ncbi:hypothetical protein INR49_024877 [Caranx melampygus]|nr:hypothetical protein INR49_024877 [Caranx melampygus]
MSSHVNTDLEQELGDLLQEFQDVVEELKAPPQSKPHAYQRVLQEAKSRMGLGDDSGVEDSDYSEYQTEQGYCSEASLGNSLNTSEEELHTAGITLAPKAKLGDTRELESFIDMLDRELAGKCEQREIASHVEGRVMGRGAGRLGATWLATAEQRGRSTPERI